MCDYQQLICYFVYVALTLLVGQQEEHPACKNGVLGTGMVISGARGS